jgi:hypothetical protein
MSDPSPNPFRDFLGGHPLRIALKLALISLIVGLILSVFGITPRNIFAVIDDTARYIYDLGFGAITGAIEYIVLGAVIVIPIWLIFRLLRSTPSQGG